MSEPQLSNKELKEQKKREKAARRAAQKAGEAPAGGAAPAAGGKPVKTAQGKAQPSSRQIKKSINKVDAEPQEISKVPSMFSHLTVHELRAKQLPLKILNLIHPKILELSQKYSSYTIVGLTARCRAMLETFKYVVSDFKPPADLIFLRSLTGHLSYQIEYLKKSRPLSVTMGNAIRWLKQEISVLSPDLAESTAKKAVIDRIDVYISEKIEYTHQMIVNYASGHFTEGCTILTFGHLDVLEKLLIHCHEEMKKNFTVIIIDSRPLFEGKQLLRRLVARGFRNCRYYLIASLTNVLEETKIDYVFLGAHAMLSNGRLYLRVGTALISMMANKKNIPVLVCCESIKFSERIQLDSVTQNELGDFENLMQFTTDAPEKKNAALEAYIEQKRLKNKKNQDKNQGLKNKSTPLVVPDESAVSPLAPSIKTNDHLKVLNIMYDLTPPHYINKIITELGALPPSSVPVIVREYKSN